MSQLEVDKIIPQSGTTLTIGDNGDTITIASGATLSGDLNADNLTSGTVPDARITGAYTGITNLTMSGLLTSNELNLTNGGVIHSTTNTNSVFIAGGTDSNVGSNIGFYGGSHSSHANRIRFRVGSSEIARFDASGNFGIGTSAPATTLHVSSGTTNTVSLIESTDAYAWLSIKDNSSANSYINSIGASGDNLQIISKDITFRTSSAPNVSTGTYGTERMRIDSSGNFMVGKTAIAYQTVGHELLASGRAFHTASGGKALSLVRLSSDGAIVDFYKDGTEIGSIGTRVNSLIIGSGDTHIGFFDSANSGSTDSITPQNGTSGAKNNAIDLGNNTNTFKDLYLGGGLYVGGTDTAHKLDDYEEGVFTPIIKFGGGTTGISATQVGKYTKVGNLVTLQIFIEFSNKGSSTGAATISGIPFTIATLTSSWSGVGTAPLVWHNMSSSLVQAGATVNRSSQTLNLFGHTASNGNGTNQALTNTDFANNSYIGITAAYLST